MEGMKKDISEGKTKISIQFRSSCVEVSKNKQSLSVSAQRHEGKLADFLSYSDDEIFLFFLSSSMEISFLAAINHSVYFLFRAPTLNGRCT